MRSLLFIPGNKPNMLDKADGCGADAVVPDMEDSVPDGEKASARSTIADWLPRLATLDALLLPRVNALATDWFDDDVTAAVAGGVWGLTIGKVDSARDISEISNAISHREREAGLELGGLKLIPWIETPLAIVNCYEICTASDRVAGVAFGGEDYANAMGIERLDDESNVAFARSTICNAARAAGVLALDTPFFRFRDQDALRQSCAAARRLGFDGRFAIHPAQIDAINECFSPSADEIAQAKRVVAAFDDAEREGRGSTSLDGRVIDVPVVKRARAVLARAGASE